MKFYFKNEKLQERVSLINSLADWWLVRLSCAFESLIIISKIEKIEFSKCSEKVVKSK